MAAPPRTNLRIEVTTDVQDRIAEICNRSGMTWISMVNRLIEFLSRQPIKIQEAILRRSTPAKKLAASQDVLKAMAAAPRRATA